MQDDARRKLENQLVVMGLSKLEDPELIVEMAKLINAHPGFTNSHSFYLGFINGCEQEKRRETYDALLPHLKFKVWPLDTYIRLLKEHAANVESYYDPVKVGTEPIKFAGNEFQQVSPGDAEGCILKLTCYKCTQSEEFYGLTPIEAITVGRADGWKRDLGMQKEICPKCAASEAPRGFFEIKTPEDDARMAKAADKRKRKSETFGESDRKAFGRKARQLVN